MKLSIIIPCYNAEPYIDELVNRLRPQLNKDVEVIIIDDGSRTPYACGYDGFKVIRKPNGGAASARNVGLDNAQGDYVAFIDADDLVHEAYIKTILNKIEAEEFDYCYMSWQTFGGGWAYSVKLKDVSDKFPPFNLCVWNRVYKRSMIGDVRFNENKPIAEDAEFIREVKEDGKKKAFIPETMYFYRTGQQNNLSSRFARGELDFDRIVYYIPEIGKNDTWLLDEIKELQGDSEIIVMTDKCELDIDGAMVLKPQRIIGTELRGKPTELFIKIQKPIKTQVVFYIGNSQVIGGIETFVYNFAVEMHDYYDIAFVYTEHMDARQLMRLSKYVRVMRNPPNKTIVCDTVINLRITDDIPKNIKYNRRIQMCHTCQMADSGPFHYKIMGGYDDLVFVSETAAVSFPEINDYKVVHNLTDRQQPKEPLVLISATRLTYEKGEERMYKLAEQFRNKNIPFLWLVFSPVPLKKNVPFVVQCPTTLDIRAFYKKADYVVQLSDKESFCYTIAEALEMGVPVLTTPISVLSELGFKNKYHGYVLPFDMENVDVMEIYEHRPEFKPKTNVNDDIIKQWRELLGDTVPTHSYKVDDEYVDVVVVENYGDIELGRELSAGEVVKMRRDRAVMLINRGFVEKSV